MIRHAEAEAVSANAPAVRVCRSPGRAILQVKSWMSDVVSRDLPMSLQDARLPDQVGSVVSGSPRVLCTAPREWLLVSQDSNLEQHSKMLATEANALGLVSIDISAGLIILRLSGSAVRDMLEKGCGLDLHPLRFGQGQCARTRFANIPVVVDLVKSPDRFELYVARSYTQYLEHWIAEAATEFDGRTV